MHSIKRTVFALMLAAATLMTGCRPEYAGDDISPQLLDELVQKQGELTTLVTMIGTLGIALLILSTALAAMLYRHWKTEVGNGE